MHSTPPKLVRAPLSAASPAPPGTIISDEISELSARVQHLEKTLQETRQRHLVDLKTLRQSQHLLTAVLDNTTALVFAKDALGRFILVNRRYEIFLNRPRADLLGKTNYDLLPMAAAERMTDEDRHVMQSGEPMEYEDELPDSSGALRTFLTVKFPLTDATGAVSGLCGVATDITDRKRAAEERATLQQQIIETQRAALRELSTPLIPLADGVLVVPLIGAIDGGRAQQILEALLDGVTAQRAHTVIIDITGVRVVDAQVARALAQAAQATRLLGARLILTGLRAEVAQALVQAGSEIGKDVATLSTLQAGIAHALRHATPKSK